MRLFAAFLALAGASGLCAASGEDFFETKIRPLLAEKCAACHGEKMQAAAVDFRKPETVIGKVAISGDESSPLIRAVRYEGRIKMPPTSKLADEEIAVLVEWVRMGAPWPSFDASAAAPAATEEEAVSSSHWAFQPVADPPPPDVREESWARNDVDRFILARLEDAGLKPAPEAPKLTLLRRAKFDLLGLPPTLEEIEQFRRDTAPGAFTRLLDRLLTSPHYGERWGRHWLDAARYADSTGVDEDHPYGDSWRYRDYVIDAFNRDLPYDRFVQEQIAGDLLPAEKPGAINTRGIIATGFLALGPKALAQRDPVQKKYDVVDEQIDTTSKTFLGLTIACSRCHDHKFDPILTKDYYALASIFAGTKSFVDWRKDGSRYYKQPLVKQEIYEAYKQRADRAAQWKRLRRTAEAVAVARYLLSGPAQGFADYMLAAAGGVERSGLDAQTAAWFEEYLKPRPALRPHLAKWRDAPASRKAAAAAAYQEELRTTIRERAETADAWLQEAIAAAREGKGAPELPELPTTLLYRDVTFEGAPYDIDAKDAAAKFGPDDRERLAALSERIEEAEAAIPPDPPMANCVAEGGSINQRVFVRGSHKNLGDPVSKRFPLALAGTGQAPIESGSGRLELARWLGSDANPLSARVMVNRIWNGHFGDGIVRTPNNFGLMGERPTHPKLLDYLAARFVASGWSVKRMHRLIMTSATYRMSSGVSEEAWAKDAGNRLWSRFKRRRLTFEEMRDSYLAAAGSLDLTIGGDLDAGSGRLVEFDRNNRRIDPDDYRRRSVYLPLMRNKLPTLLALFDFGDATTPNGKRSVTNVAPQALYVMNSGFADRAAGGIAKRLLERSSDRLGAAYKLVYARPPTERERGRARNFIEAFAARQTSSGRPQEAAWKSLCKMLLASNEFHYVD